MCKRRSFSTDKSLFLDTNAFYAFCYIFGCRNFGISGNTNERVNYCKYKRLLKRHLKKKNLFVPSSTMLEFVTKFRDDQKSLTNLLIFLSKIKNKYKYNILYHNYSDFFDFDFDRDDYDFFWYTIENNYLELVNDEKRKFCLLQKVDSEARLLTIFSRLILNSFMMNIDSKSKSITMYNRFENELFADGALNHMFVGQYFYSHWYNTIKKEIARKLYSFYCDRKEGKNKIKIFDYSMGVTVSILSKKYEFEFEINGEKTSLSTFLGDDESHYIHNIYKHYNLEKNKPLLDKIVEYFVDICSKSGYSVTQVDYIKNALLDAFMHEEKREKNDAEDFYNLGLINDNAFLITFEDELLDSIKVGSAENYYYICEFYKRKAE